MRRFSGVHARRPRDDVEVGAINTELVFDFEGVEFSDGMVIAKWYKPSPFQVVWESFPNFESFQEEHGHSQSGIVIYWADPELDTSTTARPELETITQRPPREENALGAVGETVRQGGGGRWG